MYKLALLASPLILTVLIASAGHDPGQSAVLTVPEYGLVTPQPRVSEESDFVCAAGIPILMQPGPKVQLTAQLLMARPGLLAKHLGAIGTSNIIVSREQAIKTIQACEKSSDAYVRKMHKLTVIDGQEADFNLLLRGQSFIHDVIRKPATSSSPSLFEPVIDTVREGTDLNVNVKIEDNSTVVTYLQVKEIDRIGMRACHAKTLENGKPRKLFWHEAIFLESLGSVTGAEPTSIAPDQCLVIPMAIQVRQTVGNARAYAIGGEVREVLAYEKHRLHPITQRIPTAELQQILLITARPVADEKVTPKVSLSARSLSRR